MNNISNEELAKYIIEDDLEGVQTQLKLGVTNNGLSHYNFTEQTRVYDTMVTLAVKYAGTNILELLIAHGFDVNESDDEHQTPLMIAVVHGNQFDKLNFLINAGANINKQDNFGYTALMRAVKKGKLIISIQTHFYYIILVCCPESLPCKLFLEQFTRKFLRFVMLYVITSSKLAGDVAACEILLLSGTDTSVKSSIKWSQDKEETALQIATRLGHKEIIALVNTFVNKN